MASELQMCQVHIGDYKKEIQNLNEELLQAKEKYFELRRNGKECQGQNDTDLPLQSIALGV
ncbi:hypothetical protein Mapa_017368 [Marchantia paleacea]|nr:hypothetical protein Mapa_017368 [Marchantia paleacea]